MANYGLVRSFHTPMCEHIDYVNATASSDDTVQIIDHPTQASSSSKPIPPITHPTAVKAILPISLTPLAEPYLLTGSGDVIRVYDVSSPREPELLNTVDAHWHDVTALRLWMRRTAVEGQLGKVMVEPWVISTSLDGTIRKWKLTGESVRRLTRDLSYDVCDWQNCCSLRRLSR